MSGPNFLSTALCPYEYHQHVGLTDVENGGVGIITDLRTYLVTNLGWTEPSTALFQSPADSGGHWIDLLVTRIAATNIEFRMRDNKAHVIYTRRIQIDAAGTNVNFFVGKFYVVVESLRATPEVLQAYLLEGTPDGQGGLEDLSFGTAYRNNADSIEGFGTNIGTGYAWEDASAASVYRLSRGMNTTLDWTNTFTIPRYTGSGSILVEDYAVGKFNPGKTFGRLFHAFLIDSTIANGTDKSLMVDDVNSATFRVVGLAAVGGTKFALRKSDP